MQNVFLQTEKDNPDNAPESGDKMPVPSEKE